ncbi:MAG: alpha/beta fold hydrolase [Deltaproteobacteria bacterium]|nr:alpha/beta fold hydrolase [Deltaproteobacteria bacterium]
MILKTVHDNFREVKDDLSALLTYFKFSLSGNKIERLTDFGSCQHPVLLLHGYGATRRVFTLLERRLRAAGFSVFSYNLGGIFNTFNTRSIEELAHHVKEKVERLCRRHKLKKISIIGHSKGGIIGHYYIKRLGGYRRVKNLITLGTPHYGNPWALMALFSPLSLVSRSLWEMAPFSRFLRQLNRGRFPSKVRFISIYSRKDRVCFYRSAMLEIPKGSKNMKNVELKEVSHVDYLLNKKVFDLIRKELGD